MTWGELAIVVITFTLENGPFLVFYSIFGFGGGFIAGIIFSNVVFGKGPTFMEAHQQAGRLAAEHNAQWDPKHERWEKQR